MKLDAIILGAGPAGLAVAHALHRNGRNVRIIESTNRIGGSIQTQIEEGWIVETGPNTLQLETHEDELLLAEYGLSNYILVANSQSSLRYIFAQGKLHGLSSNPLSLFKSPLLSVKAKLRLLTEPFQPRGGHVGESVASFATRRFGLEVSATLIDSIVSGIHAGDSSQLVMADCFPRIYALEQKYGSILLGLLRGHKSQRKVINFQSGMKQLADAMAAPLLPNAIYLDSSISSIKHNRGEWHVGWSDPKTNQFSASAKHLIVTVPTWKWPTLPLDGALRSLLSDWGNAVTPAITVVARGYYRKDVPHSLDGFGYLTPSNQNRGVLGCLFPSSVLPNRAPKDSILLCSFVGGIRRPDLAQLPDNALEVLLDHELSETLGIQTKYQKQWIQRWNQSIPQYNAGHQQRLSALARAENQFSGLHFHGSFRGGIALMQVIRGGDALGKQLAAG